MELNRRSFVGIIGGSVAAAAAFSMGEKQARAQLVYRTTDWKPEEFDKLSKSSSSVKQVYDIKAIGEGKFLNNIKNSLNGLEFGFGIPSRDVKIVSAMHGPSNMLNFDDEMWAKYRLGEWLKVEDPKTGKPAIRNIYLRKAASSSDDPNDRSSLYQDTSIEALQSRGVQFLSCHTATEEQVHALIAQQSLKTPAEEIVKELQAHIIPGSLIVPAMVAAIALLQTQGHYSYITV